MKTFRSKIGLEIYVPVSVIVFGTGILLARNEVWAGVSLILLLILFIVHMLITTYYQIDNDVLRIKCGFFFDRKIRISDINEISPTRNPISSPANSLDRLVIKYKKHESIIISPKEKSAFIHELKSIKPSISLAGE